MQYTMNKSIIQLMKCRSMLKFRCNPFIIKILITLVYIVTLEIYQSFSSVISFFYRYTTYKLKFGVILNMKISLEKTFYS